MEDVLNDKKPAGSFGAEKAKFFSSSFFSHLCGLMEGKDATLICISQVRDNIGVMFGEKHTRTGGKALNFYTHQVCWLAQTGRLDKTFRGQKRTYGITVKANFKRNKVAKPFRTAEFPVLFDYGIDNIESLLSYMYGGKDKGLVWNEQDWLRNDLFNLLENNDEQQIMFKQAVEKDWLEIEKAIEPKRKNRFE
jgi:recombination protein RecA